MKELLTPVQLSEWIHIRPQTLASWRLQGKGPPFLKMGSRVFYDSEEIEKWLAKNRRTSTSDPGPA